MKKIAKSGLILAFLAVNSSSFAQSKGSAVCFVNAPLVMKAHPKGGDASKLSEDANKELGAMRTKLQDIQNKITLGTATAADRQQFDVLRKTFEESSKKWQSKIDTALAPITKDIDLAVSNAAKAADCDVVLDRTTAQVSGLVVYAAPDADISNKVIAELKKIVK